MKSSLYFGEVRHHRRAPRKHDLIYSVFMPHLFLDELGKVFQGRWLWSVDRPNLSAFRRKDYHQPGLNNQYITAPGWCIHCAVDSGSMELVRAQSSAL